MNKKAKMSQVKLLFEQCFEFEFDNIESIEQVEILLRKVTKTPFEIVDLEIDSSEKEAGILYFSMRTSNNLWENLSQDTLLLGEVHLRQKHLIISGRSGFIAFPFNEVLIFMILFPLITYIMFSLVSRGIACASVVFLIGIGFMVSPLLYNIDLVRRIESVFTMAT